MRTSGEAYAFGPYSLNPQERLLLRGDEPVPLAPKAFELLVALVTAEGALMKREVLMKVLWPDSFVEEINLTVNVSILRKTLGASPEGNDYIVTVPKQGYRFGTAVSPQPRKQAAPLIQSPADSPPLPPLASGHPLTHQFSWRRRLVLLASLAAMLLAALWLVVTHRHTADSSGPVSRTLAVLPFTTLSSDPDGQYLGLGLTDALITRLGGQRQVVIRPFGAVRRYAGTTDLIAAGRQLQVDTVIDGTVQRLAGQTRVTIRLFRVDTGRMQWTGTFDEGTGGAFALEDSISEKLASTMTLQLTTEERRRLITPHTHSSEAYDLYTRGRVAWNARTVESVRQSLALFQQAVDADPQYAAAYSGLADAYILAGTYGNSFLAPAITAPKAKDALEHALALDPQSAEAHTSLAYLRLTYDWDWTGAEAEFREAIRLNPAYLNAHHWYSHELTAQGRTAESYAESEQTLALGPTDTIANEHIAWQALFAHQYDTAVTLAAKAIEIDPGFVQSHRVLGMALMYKGDFSRACPEFDTGVRLSHQDPVALAYQARCLALSGHRPQAQAIVTGLELAAQQRYISAAEIAAAHAALGDRDVAIHWLEQAATEHASALIYINVDPVFDPIRNDPRFQNVVVRVRLNPKTPMQTGQPRGVNR